MIVVPLFGTSAPRGSRPRRRLLLLLLLGQRFGFALAFRVISGLVVRRARALRDVAHDLPRVLVGDRDKAVVAVEFALHRFREAEGKETVRDLLGEIGLEVVRVGERGGREYR